VNPSPPPSLRPRPDRAAAPRGICPDAGQGRVPGSGRTTQCGDGDLLDARYEQLRHAALHARATAFPLGLAVLIGKGVAAWLTVLADVIGPPRRAPIPVPGQPDRSPAPPAALPAAVTSELVNILAAMTLVSP
jgi:hypothetical protein